MTKKKSVFRMLVITVLLGIGMNFHHPVTPTLYTAMGLPSRIFGTSMAVCILGRVQQSSRPREGLYDLLRLLWAGAAESGLLIE